MLYQLMNMHLLYGYFKLEAKWSYFLKKKYSCILLRRFLHLVMPDEEKTCIKKEIWNLINLFTTWHSVTDFQPTFFCNSQLRKLCGIFPENVKNLEKYVFYFICRCTLWYIKCYQGLIFILKKCVNFSKYNLLLVHPWPCNLVSCKIVILNDVDEIIGTYNNFVGGSRYIGNSNF